MEYDPIKIARIASNFIDNAWSTDFPCLGDAVEIWNTSDNILHKRATILGYFESEDDALVLVKIQELGKENSEYIEMTPAQIIKGAYMIDDTCYSMRIIGTSQI